MKNKYLFAALVGSMLVLAACGGQSGTATYPPANSGNNVAAPTPKTEILNNAPANIAFDPALAANASVKEALSHVYEGLVRLENDQPAAVLAIDITPSADNLDYVVTLRPGVTFHDGTYLNADAVVANFNRWFDPKDALHGSGDYTAWVTNFGGFKGETDANGKPKSEFDGIEKQNETTVILHLNQPDPNLVTKLCDPAFAIVSAEALKAGDVSKDGGTGPYKIGALTKSGVTLDPFTMYWNSANIPAQKLEITFDL